MKNNNLCLIILLMIFGFISGCASNLPLEITKPIEGSPQISEVLQNSEAHKSEQVRWGGSIASIENKKDETWVEVVSRELKRSGRPKSSDETTGRFLVKVSQFLDPEIYKKGRLITVYGELAASQDGKIGEQPYSFPVVISKKAYLWAEYRDPPPYPYSRRHYYNPFWDPYWDPYWNLHRGHRHYYHVPRYWY